MRPVLAQRTGEPNSGEGPIRLARLRELAQGRLCGFVVGTTELEFGEEPPLKLNCFFVCGL